MRNTRRILSKSCSEAQLIKALIAGEDHAYEIVVTKHHRCMLRLANAIVGQVYADDVVQEAWIKITQGIKNFKRQSSLRTWMLVIVGNVARTRYSKEKRHSSREGLDHSHNITKTSHFDDKGRWCGTCEPIKWHMNTPEEIRSCEQLKLIISSGIQTLPFSQRTALELREIEGLSLHDVAVIMDKSPGNVRVLVHRARTRLSQLIDSHQQGLAKLPQNVSWSVA